MFVLNGRGSGLLLHITSLPSRFGIGDLGPGAYRFADFLAKTQQKYWQILPLNPTSTLHDNSPYNSYLRICRKSPADQPGTAGKRRSPERNMISHRFLRFPEGYVDFPAVESFKDRLFTRAYGKFRNGSGDHAGV